MQTSLAHSCLALEPHHPSPGYSTCGRKLELSPPLRSQGGGLRRAAPGPLSLSLMGFEMGSLGTVFWCFRQPHIASLSESLQHSQSTQCRQYPPPPPPLTVKCLPVFGEFQNESWLGRVSWHLECKGPDPEP